MGWVIAFSDWNQNLSANASVVLDLITPILGVSSLNFKTTSSSSAFGGYLTPTGASGFTKGIEQGRLRSLVVNDASTGGGNAGGLVIMGSTDTLATIAGNCYRLEHFNTGASGSYSLYRSNASATVLAAIAGWTVLIAVTTITITSGTTYGLQLEFIADVTNLGGTYIKFSRGTATDFSDLATVAQYIDTGAGVITTSSSEGLYARTSGTNNLDVRMDQTSLYQLI